jgi:hypothetical protein
MKQLSEQEQEALNFLRASQKKIVNDTVAQAAWAEKRWVWIEHREEGYAAASVVAENGDQLTIEFSDGKV